MEKNTIEDINKNLDRISKLIERCDSKASIMIAALSFIFSIIFRETTINKTKEIISLFYSEISFGNLIFLFLFVVSFLGVFVGFSFLIYTLNPQLSKNYSKENVSNDDSIYFFKSIADSSFDTFKSQYEKNMNDIDLRKENLLKQIYINSEIASKKYLYFQKGLYTSFISIISLVILFFIGLALIWYLTFDNGFYINLERF